MSTEHDWYAERLRKISEHKWKLAVKAINPYRVFLQRKIGKSSVLEIGCGIGRILEWLPNAVGVDHNIRAIQLCRKKGLKAYYTDDFKFSGVDLYQSFDVLLFAHFFKHIEMNNQLKILEEYLKYLRAEGEIIVICPMEKGFLSDSTHVTFMDFESIDKLMANVGMVPVEKKSFPFHRIFGRFFIYNEFFCRYQNQFKNRNEIRK